MIQMADHFPLKPKILAAKVKIQKRRDHPRENHSLIKTHHAQTIHTPVVAQE